jgi:hypothetical protein
VICTARLIIASAILSAFAAAGTEIRLTRDLTKFPAGTYEIVQTYEMKERSTLEVPGKEAEKEQPTRTWNTFTFDLVVKPPLALVTVRRIQVRVEGKKSAAYDSKKPAEKRGEFIREQLYRLIGRTTRVDLAAYGKGKGFVGLDAAFDEYRKANPDRAKLAELNRRNYGDGRINRMFARGLEVIFGADAGRATGKVRALKQGQKFEVKLDRPGIGRKTFTASHKCVVESVRDGVVVVAVAWKENGIKPEVHEDGTIEVRGGDMVSKSVLKFHAASGLLVSRDIQVTRTDQVAAGIPPTHQRTWHSVEKTGMTIRKKD